MAGAIARAGQRGVAGVPLMPRAIEAALDSPTFWALTDADDVMVLYHGKQCLGVLKPYVPPDSQMCRHAESLNIPFGEWRQLTGTLYVFTTDRIRYFHLTDDCLDYCEGVLRCPKASSS